MRRTLAATMTVLLSLVAAACGDDDDSSQATSTAPAAGSTAAPFNEADVAFARGMIPHHQQALEMAEIALAPEVDSSAEVRDLASRIQAAQGPEIEMMTTWLEQWGVAVEGSMPGHDMSSTSEMMGEADVDALRAARGEAFDQMWMEMMIVHHEGAIEMAETEQAEGSNTEALDLAGAIIVAQRGEIDEMTQLLAQ